MKFYIMGYSTHLNMTPEEYFQAEHDYKNNAAKKQVQQQRRRTRDAIKKEKK